MSSEENSKEASESKDNNQVKPKDAPAVGEETFAAGVKVWNPLNAPAAPIPDLPDSYFEPTLNELKATYEAQVRAREALTNAPFKTREAREKELKVKQEQYPTTRIRVKFPDRTQLERAFPSTDKIRSVYAFVRGCLRDDVKPIKFVLYQTPPRRELKVSDLKVRDLTLYELQLAPSSVLMLSFFDESLNDPSLRAPLMESILAQAQDLPLPPSTADGHTTKSDESEKDIPVAPKSSSGNSKPLPKWFKMGKK